MNVYAIAALSLVLFCLLIWGANRYRMRHIVTRWSEDAEDLDADLTQVELAVSAVVVSEDAGASLERNMPALMAQANVAMEAIVVNADRTKDADVQTADAVKRLTARYPMLRQTYVPQSSHGLDVAGLGRMLGARAARHEWLLFVSPDFVPPSNQWLLDLLQYADATVCAIVDYGRTGCDEALSFWRRWRLRRNMMRAARSGQRIQDGGGSVLVQRDWYMKRLSGAPLAGECVYLYTDAQSRHRNVVRAFCK